MKAVRAITLAVLSIGVAPAWAEVFKCTDVDGAVTFQETPCAFVLSEEAIDELFGQARELALRGDTDAFIEFIDQNALAGFANGDGQTATVVACGYGDPNACRWALDSVADPQMRDLERVAALGLAASQGRVDNLSLLMAGARRIGPSTLSSALRNAVQAGQFDAARVLLEKGADANAADDQGMSALMLSVRTEHRELVRLMLRHGGQPSHEISGRTAIELALGEGHDEMLSALNPATIDVLAEGVSLTIPTPQDGWACDAYGAMLGIQARTWLFDDASAACFLEAASVKTLSGAQAIGIYTVSFLSTAMGGLDDNFQRTASEYRSNYERVFVDRPNHLGASQVRERRVGGVDQVSTCAVIVTRLPTRVGVISYCHHSPSDGQGGDAVVRTVSQAESAALRWHQRISSLNQ